MESKKKRDFVVIFVWKKIVFLFVDVLENLNVNVKLKKIVFQLFNKMVYRLELKIFAWSKIDIKFVFFLYFI